MIFLGVVLTIQAFIRLAQALYHDFNGGFTELISSTTKKFTISNDFQSEAPNYPIKNSCGCLLRI